MIKYLSALKHAAVIIGNSSSGIIEAPTLKVPTVNIGDRQKGRVMVESVICCPPVALEIIKSIKKALIPKLKDVTLYMEKIFGEVNTSQRILGIILNTAIIESMIKKSFYDLK